MNQNTKKESTPSRTSNRTGPDVEKAKEALRKLAVRLEYSEHSADLLLGRFIVDLEIRLKDDFSMKPGWRWLPGVKRPGTWARVPTQHWTMMYLRPSVLPPRSPKEFWANRKLYWTSRTPLTRTQVAGHLIGPEVRGQHRADETKLAIIDIDKPDVASPDKWKRTSVNYRYRLLIAALGDLPHVPIQSSDSKGLHGFFRFDEVVRGPELKLEIERRIREAGLPVRPGVFEVFPKGRANFRLPMGQGSRLLLPGSLKAWAEGRTVTRGEEVTAFLDALENATVSRRVFQPKPTPASAVSATSRTRPTTTITTRTKSANTGDSKYLARIKKGVTAYGKRDHETFVLVRHWRKECRLSRKHIRRKYEHWIDTGKHKSKTFEHDPVRAKTLLLADLDSMLDRIDQYQGSYGSSAPTPYVARFTEQYLSLFSYRLDVLHLAKKLGFKGKSRERKALKPWMYREDAELWAGKHPWLRLRLAKLVALLRYAQEHGHVELLALDSETLHHVCGHAKPPPELALTYRRGSAEWRLERVAYRPVLRAAKNLGLIRYVKGGREKRHGAVFRLTLPTRNPAAKTSSQ